jgi:tetratricopeptide (TPR) repeat protein
MTKASKRKHQRGDAARAGLQPEAAPAGVEESSGGAASHRRWLPKLVIGAVALLALALLYRAVLPPLLQSGAGELSIVYPFDGSLFPPEIIAPTVWWDDSNSHANRWRVSVAFANDTDPISAEVDTTAWTPDSTTWESIKSRSVGTAATITVVSVRTAPGMSVTLSSDSVAISTSSDSVGAPIFYRDVPLPFSFALRNVPMIRWRLGDIASYDPPPVVLTNLPVCGNCHSFSLDGKYLGMDVDVGNDKGAYVLTSFDQQTLVSRDKLISWTDFVPGMKIPTFGMLARVSPDGRYVLAGVKDRVVFLPREDILFSQIFFPVMGILAYYDRTTGEITALHGADDDAYVQANASWTPDGNYVYFARNTAAHLETQNPNYDILLSVEESAEVLGGEEFLWNAQEGGKEFRFNLFRVPFNDGRGGTPEPIEGASNNGRSNYFPKISPDGKWLVFTQAHSFMLLQPDSKLYIVPADGGEPRLMNANTDRMNSWHSWSPNSKWLVFSTKLFGPYTQLFLTHIDENGNDSRPVWLRNFTAADRAVNIPEFVNIPPSSPRVIQEAFVDDYNYYRSGRIYEQFRLYDRAEEEFSKSVRLNPENTGALYSLGSIYAGRGDYEEAEGTFKNLLEIDPGSPIVHKDLGNLYVQMQEYDKAEAEFQTALRLDPRNVEARYNLGTVYLIRAELVDAERELRMLLNLDVDSATAVGVHGKLAAIYMQRNDYRRAIPQFEALLALDPENMDVRYNLGVGYRTVNDLPKAREMFKTIVERNPNDVEAHNHLGEIYASLQSYPEALVEFRRVVELEPMNVPGLINLGRVCYLTRDFECAETALLNAASLDPSNRYAHVNLGRVYYETARYDKAVPVFQHLVEISPNDASAWFMLGEALVREGRSIPEAITAFENGLAQAPNYLEGHITLGDLYSRNGDLEAAIDEFQSALRLNTQDARLQSQLAGRIDDLRRRLQSQGN